ncbi:putative ent-kaurene synthase [Helianthus annuus]|uniref:Ent-kaurene synthase n=1 Tax=Helianthus annuus TaxID=4232 RepID=A0A9K3JVB1_HELAN|nr:putative ent-kaurene synthase [Helianthus annuus]
MTIVLIIYSCMLIMNFWLCLHRTSGGPRNYLPGVRMSGSIIFSGGAVKTLTTPVQLIKCLKSIKNHVFIASEYPVVITLKDHLITDLQSKAALRPIVLPAIYFVGPKLSKENVESFEYHYLYELRSIQDRLRNEIHSFKREFKEGKLTIVELHLSNIETENVEEEVVKEMMTKIKNNRSRRVGVLNDQSQNRFGSTFNLMNTKSSPQHLVIGRSSYRNYRLENC